MAGMKVKAQGVFKTKVLTKEHVEHLINDDGAKFDNRNADGTVTEVGRAADADVRSFLVKIGLPAEYGIDPIDLVVTPAFSVHWRF